ncbi:hypothetical protein [Sphingomonas sp. CFBP 13728]|uniref:hypothetical protein n=1 Tax=Sphingomonas sp. CFBP 13728 TaxID=2775294 RepID=UPI001FD43386|nr:hypothetical protein [Sphingomonas sp. CFBP 13728]
MCTEITSEHYDETYDINVKGTIFTVQKGLKLMGQGGSIIHRLDYRCDGNACVQHLQRFKSCCS